MNDRQDVATNGRDDVRQDVAVQEPTTDADH